MERKTIIESYEEKKKKVEEFNLTSDLFAGKVFEDVGACQELCRILLQCDRIVLRKVHTQYTLRNLENHSVELDILAEEENGNLINIEIQMYQEKNPFKRARYYTSAVDMSILEKGKPYEQLPKVTIIYLTKKDFIGEKRGYYNISRKADGQEVVMSLDNGIREKYFNLEFSTEDDRMNELLEYFEHSDAFYQTKHFPRIVERVNYFKVQKEGVSIMCEIADRIRREGEEAGKIEGKIESVLALLEEMGNVPQQIVNRIQKETNLTVLGTWLKCAARVSSISEFEASMKNPYMEDIS